VIVDADDNPICSMEGRGFPRGERMEEIMRLIISAAVKEG
jgi:hypothetical protein